MVTNPAFIHWRGDTYREETRGAAQRWLYRARSLAAAGIPLAGAEPFVLDYATSRVAQGKMRVGHNKGGRVPPGYLIDENGAPTDDPGVVVVPQGNGLFGALMTFGEHKGYGMALACELLGGALTGGGTWHRPADTSRSVLNGMLTVLIDPERLGTQASFDQEAREFVESVRADVGQVLTHIYDKTI